MWREFRLFFTTDLSTVTEALTKPTRYPLEGVAYDPRVQGNREISVIYSPEFRRIMIEKNGKAKQDPFRAMLENNAWGVFDVCCDNMRGVEKGLDWVLHHLAKKRREWTYHSMQGQNG